MPVRRVGLLLTDVDGSVGKCYSNISTIQRFTALCVSKLKLRCISEVILCAKLVPCVLFWKEESHYKMSELEQVGVHKFYTFQNKVLIRL
jgi:hypothetical protein